METIYERIKRLREEKGLSQDDLAKILGYKSRSTINKIEKGKNDISQSRIKAFANALGTTPAYLMGWEEETQQAPSSREQMLKELDGVQFALYSETQDLTDEQLEDVIKFVRFLKTQGKDK